MADTIFAAQVLSTQFSKSIRRRCADAIAQYQLICPQDKIAVCVSGGKDSMLLAIVLRELQQHGLIPFSLVFLAMDPGYSPQARAHIVHNAQQLQLDLQFFDTDIFRVVRRHSKNPCFLCAKMRRGWLYSQAQALGCNKIALGHHYDDIVETILMSMIYGGQIQTMLPRVDSANFPGMQLIRPLYFVRQADIQAWVQACQLDFTGCSCTASVRQESSKRLVIRQLIAQLCQTNPQIKQNIMHSVQNIDLRKVLGAHWDEQQFEVMKNEP